MLIKIIRKQGSFEYKYKEQINNYQNNIKNNSLDTILIMNEGTELFSANCQTVSNHPDFKHRDTIQKGTFKIKCFVESRKFHGEIHGIIDAYDIENQKINNYSMQLENGQLKGRWLVHDKWYDKIQKDSKYAYSGGCFVLSSEDLEQFNKVLRKNKIVDNQVINGILVEEEKV